MKTVHGLVSLAVLGAMMPPMPAGDQGIDYASTEFNTAQRGPNVYVLTGSRHTDPGHPEAAGGRVGLLVGPEGVLMVDASYAPLAPRIEDIVGRLSVAPVRIVVDTHAHPDHTGGNPEFASQGALIFARSETRAAMAEVPPPAVLKAVGQAADFTNPARLPIVTYGLGAPITVHLDGETVDLIPLPSGHTNGDTAVRFEKADVIMIGDFYRNYGYPFIDAGHGGTFKGMIEAIDLIGGLAGPDTKLVPGHGGLITRGDLVPYRAMVLDIRGKVGTMIAAGKSRREVIAAHLTAPYDSQVEGGLDPLPAGLGTSADRFVGAMYDEVSGKPAQPLFGK